MLGHDFSERSGTIVDDTNLRECRGLTPDELAGLDWSQIDLQEWIDLMMASGIMPDETSEDTLTGDGRALNSGARESGVSRNLDRVTEGGENQWADRAIEGREVLKVENVDCSYLPRPLMCEYDIPTNP